MKDFDYIIIGGGCSGLSLAFELNKNNQLIDKTPVSYTHLTLPTSPKV